MSVPTVINSAIIKELRNRVSPINPVSLAAKIALLREMIVELQPIIQNAIGLFAIMRSAYRTYQQIM